MDFRCTDWWGGDVVGEEVRTASPKVSPTWTTINEALEK
jgi:hypothetical protein